MKNGANEIVGGGMPVDIRSRILTIRGVQVMLDRDLAELYDVPTGALNQAVKRNAKRFPERFVFQLSEKEFANWKSQAVSGLFVSSEAGFLRQVDLTPLAGTPAQVEKERMDAPADYR